MWLAAAGRLAALADHAADAARASALWLVAAAFTVVICGSVIFNVTSVTFRQRMAPAHLLGRVNATMRFLILGLMPVGALIGGALGSTIGVRNTLWFGCVGGALVVAARDVLAAAHDAEHAGTGRGTRRADGLTPGRYEAAVDRDVRSVDVGRPGRWPGRALPPRPRPVA